MTSQVRWAFAALVACIALVCGIGYAGRIGAAAQGNAATAVAAMGTGPVAPTMIGMNLGNPNYWSAEWTFDDIVQSTGALWMMTPEGRWVPVSDQVKTDATGHPIDVPAGTRLIVMVQKGSPHLPLGSYNCRISKGWAIRNLGAWRISGSGPSFRMDIYDFPANPEVQLLLTATAAHAELKEMSCRSANGAGRLFNPAFLADNKPFRVLRFMDWMKTNGAPLRKWSERPTPELFSQAGPQGVAIEHIIALSNALHSDPWINMPFDADPDYYRALATYVHDHLDKDRRVYVELSNEVWNTSFQQGKDAMSRGTAAYPGILPAQAADYYYADRVRAAMATWTQVFGADHKRLVRVLASQAVNARRAEWALSHLDTWRSVDALATAPYFGTTGGEIAAAAGPARVDAVFARGPALVGEAIGYALANKAVAHKYGLRYIAYEGGPGFMAYVPDVRADMITVNSDPRMHDLYTLFLKRWQAEIGDLFVAYDAVSTPSGGGNWGHRKYTGQPLAEAPKARALTEFAIR